MWGRGLRSSPETGKTECLLLDFSGNIIRFADDFAKVYFEGLDKLEVGEKLDKEIRKDEEHEPRACPKCGYTPMGKRCVGCGFEPMPMSLVEQRPGVMAEFSLNGKRLAANHDDLYAQLATYAKMHSKPEKQNKRAAGLFKEMVGKWPPLHCRVETTPWVDPTQNTINKIKSMNIAFAHRSPA
jgi:hypothetical protein